ncbi:hypothetical protein [Halomonas sp. E14]|uniref:hypothetical protein n=1 Tax=Halomonas sp. E14 TaxID=3397245 RepID=UPI00403EA4E2
MTFILGPARSVPSTFPKAIRAFVIATASSRKSDGNGRAQRILFEHLIINCGYEISWAGLDRDEWIRANIAAYYCDYDLMVAVFRQCIGAPLAE